ncbi:MAG TPA: SAM-dependent methyltransferase, partial [Rhizorhapis sp.]|nr:SAM-dependent methyltransferase [Rhizorhapis sp.]
VAGWLKPGGTLVYATCSLERAEGEEQVARLLEKNRAFSLEAAPAELLPVGIAPTPEGWIRTLPGMLAAEGRLDGFFIARLRRS